MAVNCIECGNSFKNEKGLSTHMGKKHPQPESNNDEITQDILPMSEEQKAQAVDNLFNAQEDGYEENSEEIQNPNEYNPELIVNVRCVNCNVALEARHVFRAEIIDKKERSFIITFICQNDAYLTQRMQIA